MTTLLIFAGLVLAYALGFLTPLLWAIALYRKAVLR